MDIKITSVLGNAQKLDGGAMFGNVPRALWSRWCTPDELGRILLNCRCMLIQIDGEKILCETGIGAFMEPKFADRFGVQNPEHHILLENLYALGINQEDIDAVILSHLHFDHAGGLLPTHKAQKKGATELLFPNAMYLVGKEALERSENPHMRDKASFIPDLPGLLKQSGRLQIVDGPTCPGFYEDRISFVFTDGHTPGQMHTVIRGSERSIIFAGDLVPGTPWVHLPITMGYDRSPEKLIDEKKALYQSIDTDSTWFFYTHDTETSCSRIEKNENGKYYASDFKDSLNSWSL